MGARCGTMRCEEGDGDCGSKGTRRDMILSLLPALGWGVDREGHVLCTGDHANAVCAAISLPRLAHSASVPFLHLLFFAFLKYSLIITIINNDIISFFFLLLSLYVIYSCMYACVFLSMCCLFSFLSHSLSFPFLSFSYQFCLHSNHISSSPALCLSPSLSIPFPLSLKSPPPHFQYHSPLSFPADNTEIVQSTGPISPSLNLSTPLS